MEVQFQYHSQVFLSFFMSTKNVDHGKPIQRQMFDVVKEEKVLLNRLNFLGIFYFRKVKVERIMNKTE